MKRGRVKPRNEARKVKAYARNYGEESDLVRLMPCAVGPSGCGGLIEVAHDPSRGAGGGRFDVGPLCKVHHAEQGSIGILTFQARHSVDLRELWDEIAIGHAPPLGIRGLADRWMEHAILTDYEVDALTGFVRRYRLTLDQSRAAMTDMIRKLGIVETRPAVQVTFEENLMSHLCIGSNARPGSEEREAYLDRVRDLVSLAA